MNILAWDVKKSTPSALLPVPLPCDLLDLVRLRRFSWEKESGCWGSSVSFEFIGFRLFQNCVIFGYWVDIKMGTIKDRNGMHLTETEDIKKRWQEYPEELYRKHLNDPENHDGVITHLEPDILECEVKWAFGIITINKASGGDGIPAELFQILKDDAFKVLHSISQQIWKAQQ